jgi:hypothetical protein
LLYAFFNLAPILIGQRVPELSPFLICGALPSSGPLTDYRVIMFAIRIDFVLIIVHQFPCFIEFCS